MRWFYDLSFRFKLLLPLGAIIVTTMSFGLLTVASVNLMKEDARLITGSYLPAVELVLEADRDLHQALIAERELVIGKLGSEAMAESQSAHGENIGQVRKRMGQVAQLSEDPQIDRLVDRFFEQFERWEANTKMVVKMAAMDPEKSLVLSMGGARASFDTTRETIDEMTEILHASAEEAGEAVEAAADTVYFRQILGNGVILSLLLAVALVLPPLVTRVVHAIRDQVEDMARGEGDLTQRIEVTTRDELGQLSRSFNRFMEKLQKTMGDVAGYTREVAAASQQLSTISAQNTRLVTQQHGSVEMVVTAANEMSSAIQDVARNTNAAAAEAQTADRQSGSGKRQLQQTIGAMTGLRESVEDAREVIARLAEDATQIASVIDSIRGIAEQTNLLALNAAIEAARAGEQGRGFAVVADEVRTLASRTQQSTQDIEETIGRLQGGVDSAVAAMQAGSGKADTTLADARQTEAVLIEITQSVQRISDMNTQIASAAEQQSTVTEDINENLVTIGDLSRQVATGAEKTSDASAELARLATQLQDVVSQFRI